MNKQTLIFYVKKSNGVVTQIGRGCIWQQAPGAEHVSVEATSKRQEVSE